MPSQRRGGFCSATTTQSVFPLSPPNNRSQLLVQTVDSRPLHSLVASSGNSQSSSGGMTSLRAGPSTYFGAQNDRRGPSVQRPQVHRLISSGLRVPPVLAVGSLRRIHRPAARRPVLASVFLARILQRSRGHKGSQGHGFRLRWIQTGNRPLRPSWLLVSCRRTFLRCFRLGARPS